MSDDESTRAGREMKWLEEKLKAAERRGFMRAVEILRDPELIASRQFVGLEFIANWLEEKK